MSDLGFNKIAGAVLAAGLAIVFLNQISEKVFVATSVSPNKMGDHVDVVLDGGPAPIVLPSPDWGSVIPAADLAKGAAVFVKCASCHKPTDENGTGPGLLAVVGRAPASHPNFAYSDAMKAFGGKTPKWDFDTLETYLTKPQAMVPGTKMTFTGLSKQEDRIAVIAYLHSLGSSIPVPAADPKRAQATADALAGKQPGAAAAPAAGAAAGTPAAAPVAAAGTAPAGSPASPTPPAKAGAAPAAPAAAAPKAK